MKMINTVYLQPLFTYYCRSEEIDKLIWICESLNDPFLRIFS